MAKIKIRIYTDGIVQAETYGIKGKKCKDYINMVQDITESKVVEQEYTSEYYEEEIVEMISENEKIIGDI